MNPKEGDRVTLRSPQMREKLLNILHSLADAEYQNKLWLNQELIPAVEFDYCKFGVHFIYFDLAFNFVYDDTSLVKNPEGAIGLFLKNNNEVQMIKAVLRAIERVFETVGIDAADKEYISCPQWSNVLETALHALQTMEDDSECHEDGV